MHVVGYDNVKQSVENNIGPVHDLLQSASEAMTNSVIVYAQGCRQNESKYILKRMVLIIAKVSSLFFFCFFFFFLPN